ncbi:hypothetical protein HYU07_06605 [Candidatus Woesearchaeota archaeon]|nr:hypothetical protein [Candidatus Woesearchaeota archaeon]
MSSETNLASKVALTKRIRDEEGEILFEGIIRILAINSSGAWESYVNQEGIVTRRKELMRGPLTEEQIMEIAECHEIKYLKCLPKRKEKSAPLFYVQKSFYRLY